MATRKRKSNTPARTSKPKQPRNEEQSGSTGRPAASGPQPDKDAGQDHYGQSGFAGVASETEGQARYRRSGNAPRGRATKR